MDRKLRRCPFELSLIAPAFQAIGFILWLLCAISTPIADDIYVLSWAATGEGVSYKGYKWGLWGGCHTDSGAKSPKCNDAHWGYWVDIVNTDTNERHTVLPEYKMRALGFLVPFIVALTFTCFITSLLVALKISKVSRKKNINQQQHNIIPKPLVWLASSFAIISVPLSIGATVLCRNILINATNSFKQLANEYTPRWGACYYLLVAGTSLFTLATFFGFVIILFRRQRGGFEIASVSTLRQRRRKCGSLSPRLAESLTSTSDTFALPSLRKFDTSWGAGSGKWSKMSFDDQLSDCTPHEVPEESHT